MTVSSPVEIVARLDVERAGQRVAVEAEIEHLLQRADQVDLAYPMRGHVGEADGRSFARVGQENRLERRATAERQVHSLVGSAEIDPVEVTGRRRGDFPGRAADRQADVDLSRLGHIAVVQRPVSLVRDICAVRQELERRFGRLLVCGYVDQYAPLRECLETDGLVVAPVAGRRYPLPGSRCAGTRNGIRFPVGARKRSVGTASRRERPSACLRAGS